MKIYNLTSIQAVTKLLLEYSHTIQTIALPIAHYLLQDLERCPKTEFNIKCGIEIYQVAICYSNSRYIVVINPLN